MPCISFFQAARRLHSDGIYLANDTVENRELNAGHFFGLAAECGLKYLLLLCNGLNRNTATGDLIGPRPHVDKLINTSGLASTYKALISGHTHARYLSSCATLSALHTWKAEFRYYDRTHVDYPVASEAAWKTASEEIQLALDSAKLDGHPIHY